MSMVGILIWNLAAILGQCHAYYLRLRHYFGGHNWSVYSTGHFRQCTLCPRCETRTVRQVTVYEWTQVG